MSKTIDAMKQALNEALAWGMTYGPIIPADQWDEMRDKQVEQHLATIADKEAQTVEPIGWLHAGTAFHLGRTRPDERARWEPVFTHPAQRPSAEPKGELWTNCVFQGNPPPAYTNWMDFASAKVKEGITIRASALSDWSREPEPKDTQIARTPAGCEREALIAQLFAAACLARDALETERQWAAQRQRDFSELSRNALDSLKEAIKAGVPELADMLAADAKWKEMYLQVTAQTCRAEDELERLQALQVAVPQAVEPVARVVNLAGVHPEWVAGPSLFKDWCSEFFGPDSDEAYLAKAVLSLPLFTAPQEPAALPPSAEPKEAAATGERAELIAEARQACKEGRYSLMSGLLMQCAAMLAADAPVKGVHFTDAALMKINFDQAMLINDLRHKLNNPQQVAVPQGTQIVRTPASGDREALIAELNYAFSMTTDRLFKKAADMLAADAKPTDVNRYTQATLAGHANGLAEGLAMAADAQQVAVPQGWKRVPVEPTGPMLEAMNSSGWMIGCYRAMLAAAPQPPQGEAK